MSLSFLSTSWWGLFLLALSLSLFCEIDGIFNDSIEKNIEDDGEGGNDSQNKEDACETLQVFQVEEHNLHGLTTAGTHFFLTLTLHLLGQVLQQIVSISSSTSLNLLLPQQWSAWRSQLETSQRVPIASQEEETHRPWSGQDWSWGEACTRGWSNRSRQRFPCTFKVQWPESP